MKKKKLLSLLATFCMALMLCPVTAFAYSEPETETEPTPTPEPVIEETVEEDTSFSIPGNGEVLDDITDDSSKEFFTVTTANGNTFFLVIDRSQNTENVYMLSMIDEADLQDFIEEGADEETSQGTVVLEEPVEPVEEPAPTEEPVEVEEESSNGMSILLVVILLAALGGVGAYFYFKIYKPQHEQDESESENMEISDGLETINEDETADTDEDADADSDENL